MNTHCKHCGEEFGDWGCDAPDEKYPDTCTGCIDNDFFECEDCGKLTKCSDGVKIVRGWPVWYCEDCAETHQTHGENERADFQIKEAKEAA